MLDSAANWRHWGGVPDEDILVEFGLRTEDFYARVREAIESGAADYLERDVIAQLLSVCRRQSGSSDVAQD